MMWLKLPFWFVLSCACYRQSKSVRVRINSARAAHAIDNFRSGSRDATIKAIDTNLSLQSIVVDPDEDEHLTKESDATLRPKASLVHHDDEDDDADLRGMQESRWKIFLVFALCLSMVLLVIIGPMLYRSYVRHVESSVDSKPSMPEGAAEDARPSGVEAIPPQDGDGSVDKMILVALFGGLYVAFSAGLIAYNKFLMHADRFPFAIALVLLHSIFCTLCTGILFLCKPSLFPSLTDPVTKVNVDKSLILKGAMPIAVFFAAQLVLSNTAYLHSSVAFLQMMKECNIVLVYVFSLIAVLENFSWRSVGILLFIVAATTLTINGEVNFSWTGFLIQGTGQLFECCRIVLQAMLLTSAGRKLDALTYVMLVMPFCVIFLAVGYGMLTIFPQENFTTPEWRHFVQWWPHLLGNACIAFGLNVVIALFVKHSSAVAFILVGILKDAMIVAAGGIIFKEAITLVQGVGFFLQLVGIVTWSMIKLSPTPTPTEPVPKQDAPTEGTAVKW